MRFQKGQNGSSTAAKPGLLPPSIVSENLYRMSVREIWKFVIKQPLSFWTLVLYLFMEYVRPQIVYRQLDILPFAQIFIFATALLFLIEGRKFRRWQAADSAICFFVVALLLSIAFAWRPKLSLPNLFVPMSWVFIYFLITNVIDNQPRYVVFMLSFMLHSLKMSQHGTRSFVEGGGQFRAWGATGAPGFFQNSGEFAIQMCIFFGISVMFFLSLRPYLSRFKQLFFLILPGTAVISVVASSSRGGQLALAAVIGWLMMKALYTKHKAKALGGAAIALVLGLILIPPEQWTRFSEMGTDDTSLSRLTY
jgi:putative inorganic carbon (hco3(-)) transporter